jgi:hypothetical protein
MAHFMHGFAIAAVTLPHPNEEYLFAVKPGQVEAGAVAVPVRELTRCAGLKDLGSV